MKTKSIQSGSTAVFNDRAFFTSPGKNPKSLNTASQQQAMPGVRVSELLVMGPECSFVDACMSAYGQRGGIKAVKNEWDREIVNYMLDFAREEMNLYKESSISDTQLKYEACGLKTITLYEVGVGYSFFDIFPMVMLQRGGLCSLKTPLDKGFGAKIFRIIANMLKPCPTISINRVEQLSDLSSCQEAPRFG